MKHEPDQHDMADAQTVRSDFLAAVAAQDHKGFSEEQCFRCGWVMGRPALNCQNDDTPHRFPSHSLVRADERAERIACICDTNPHTTDGPSEYCPQHGRPYVEAYDGGYRAGRADERKAAARDALAAVREVEPVRDVDYPLHLIERREVLTAIAAALGEGL